MKLLKRCNIPINMLLFKGSRYISRVSKFDEDQNILDKNNSASLILVLQNLDNACFLLQKGF